MSTPWIDRVTTELSETIVDLQRQIAAIEAEIAGRVDPLRSELEIARRALAELRGPAPKSAKTAPRFGASETALAILKREGGPYPTKMLTTELLSSGTTANRDAAYSCLSRLSKLGQIERVEIDGASAYQLPTQ